MVQGPVSQRAMPNLWVGYLARARFLPCDDGLWFLIPSTNRFFQDYLKSKKPSSDAKPRRAPNLIQVDGSSVANAGPMATRATWPRR